MDPIGVITPFVPPTPALPAPSQGPTITLPDPAPSQATIGGTNDQPTVDVQAAEQRRYQAVQRAAQEIANVYIVSDRTFTIFKDITGQYITRFTSLRDGKVTYIPEPEVFKLSRQSASAALNITA